MAWSGPPLSSAGDWRKEIAALTAHRVCILRHGFYPSDVRVRREVNALVAAGFEVDIVALRRPGQAGKEEINGATVYRVPVAHERSRHRLRYLFQYSASFALIGLLVSTLHLRRRYDLVQVNTMPDFLAFAALVPKLLGARLVLDIHDLMPEIYMTKFPVPPSHPIVRLLKLQEGVSMRLADRVITVIEELRQILVERHGQRDISVIMNCPDGSVLPRRAPVPPSSKPGDRFVLLSHGVIVERLGYDTAIRAVALLRDRIPGLELRIIGPGDYAEELKKLAASLGVSHRVRFTGLVPLDEIPDLVAQADLGVVANKNDGSADIMLPTKLLEYAWLGKPAVVARTATIAHYFDDAMVSYFTPGDANQLAERIFDLYLHPERRYALAVRSSRFFEEHNWAAEAARYCALLDALCDRSNLQRQQDQRILSMPQQPTVNAYFDSQATFWKDLYASSGVYAVIHQERQAVVLRWIDELGLAPGACILDIGCGAGFVSISLAQRGFSVHAIDAAEAMVEQTRRNATEVGLADRISVAVGDVYRLDEPDDAYDLVLAIGVLPWLDQPHRAIREMARVTRPGGNVILTVDNWSRLDHLLDPWLNPLVVPLKRHAKALLERFGRRRRTIDDVGARDLRRSVIDRELGRAGLVKVRDHGLGFGPFSYFRQHLFPEPLGTTLHHRLQRLADRGVPGLHVAAAQYIVQAQKEADCRRA